MYNYKGLLKVRFFFFLLSTSLLPCTAVPDEHFFYYLVLAVSKPFLTSNSMHTYFKFLDETWC